MQTGLHFQIEREGYVSGLIAFPERIIIDGSDKMNSEINTRKISPPKYDKQKALRLMIEEIEKANGFQYFTGLDYPKNLINIFYVK